MALPLQGFSGLATLRNINETYANMRHPLCTPSLAQVNKNHLYFRKCGSWAQMKAPSLISFVVSSTVVWARVLEYRSCFRVSTYRLHFVGWMLHELQRIPRNQNKLRRSSHRNKIVRSLRNNVIYQRDLLESRHQVDIPIFIFLPLFVFCTNRNESPHPLCTKHTLQKQLLYIVPTICL